MAHRKEHRSAQEKSERRHREKETKRIFGHIGGNRRRRAHREGREAAKRDIRELRWF